MAKRKNLIHGKFVPFEFGKNELHVPILPDRAAKHLIRHSIFGGLLTNYVVRFGEFLGEVLISRF